MLYFLPDKTIELSDIKTRRVVLKRCSQPTPLTVSELYIGATITVHARKLKIVEYGDQLTRSVLSEISESQVTMLPHMGITGSTGTSVFTRFLEQVTSELGCRVLNLRIVDLAKCPELVARIPNLPLRSGIVCFAHLVVVNAHVRVAEFAAKYYSRDNVWCSADPAQSNDVCDTVFKTLWPCTARLANCTVCIVKPHLASDPTAAAALLNAIHNTHGFSITAILVTTLTAADASDFFEVYQGVLPEFRAVCDHAASGISWIIEICAENAVEEFRKLAGPYDPEIARLVRPQTLRAKYGVNKVLNGIHCTDLTEDGTLESEFFFDLLWNASK
jgi:nucleoside-diphosphate kinase